MTVNNSKQKKLAFVRSAISVTLNLPITAGFLTGNGEIKVVHRIGIRGCFYGAPSEESATESVVFFALSGDSLPGLLPDIFDHRSETGYPSGGIGRRGEDRSLDDGPGVGLRPGDVSVLGFAAQPHARRSGQRAAGNLHALGV